LGRYWERIPFIDEEGKSKGEHGKKIWVIGEEDWETGIEQKESII
jgi:hypothetical protein